jgi:hypothetical protein
MPSPLLSLSAPPAAAAYTAAAAVVSPPPPPPPTQMSTLHDDDDDPLQVPLGRENYHTVKHSFCPAGVLPLWVADQDLPVDPHIHRAIQDVTFPLPPTSTLSQPYLLISHPFPGCFRGGIVRGRSVQRTQLSATRSSLLSCGKR